MIFNDDYLKTFIIERLKNAVDILQKVSCSLSNKEEGAEIKKLIGEASGLVLEAVYKLTGGRNIYKRK